MKVSDDSASGQPEFGARDLLGDGDYFARWPTAFILVAPLTVGLAFSFAPPSTMLIAPAVIMITFFAALFAAIFTVHYVWTRKWRRAVSTIVLPVYVGAALLAPDLMIAPLARAGVWARFLLARSSYEQEIVSLPANTPRFRVFDWGSFAGINVFVVYDESDQVALPIEARSSGPREQRDICDGTAHRLTGHFYFC